MSGSQKGHRTDHNIGVQTNNSRIANFPWNQSIKGSISKDQYQGSRLRIKVKGSIAKDQHQRVNIKGSIKQYKGERENS